MVEEMTALRTTGSIDPGWEHGMAQDERKKKVKCNYCGKVVSGGIFRLKQHLARISGEVTHCEKVPEEVCLKMKKNLEGCRSGRKRRQLDYERASFTFHCNDYNEDEEEHASNKQKGKEVAGDKSTVISLTPVHSLGYVDPGWEHCVAQDERKKKVKCNYCEKVISGGINRFKQHLARIPGEVAFCKKAPEDVYLKIKENMKWHRSGRRRRKPDDKEVSAFSSQSDNDDEDEEPKEEFPQSAGKDKIGNGNKISGNAIRKSLSGRFPGTSSNAAQEELKRARLDSIVRKTIKTKSSPLYLQVKSKMASDKKVRKEAISAICKFFYYAGIPSSMANSIYFHKMLELVGQCGQGLKVPSSRLMSDRSLQEEIGVVNELFMEYKSSWAITGCSIMADSWKDVHGRTLINFLVSCPRGMHFVSSVDATDIVEDARKLFKLLDDVVEQIGEEHVIQVITRNTASYKNAGKMLEEKRRNLFWTPCAIHCIDQMLEDFIHIKWVGECVNKGKRITRFIYNHTWLFNLMKEFTEGQGLLNPSITRFATCFFTLQSLSNQRIGLKKMFQSSKWLSSRFAKSEEGREVEKAVLNATFWKKMQYLRKSLEPIMQIHQKLESDESLAMPIIYSDMCKAKIAIKAIHGDDARKYGPFWTAIDSHWNQLFHHPLYVAAYFLNPSFRYRPDFLLHPEIIRGLNECIVRLEPDNGKRISASMQISDYNAAKDDFGTELAISTRIELEPASWWQQHGINCLELQRIAIRILSQTCSSFGCQHTWSTYDQIHHKRYNRLSRKRLNEFVYVHYNLRLRERRFGRKTDDSISMENAMLESLLDDWIVESEKQAVQEDEEILYNEMEQFYEDDDKENETGSGEPRKRPAEMNAMAMVESLRVNTVSVGATTEDDDLDFLDDDLTEGKRSRINSRDHLSFSAMHAEVSVTGVPRSQFGRSHALIKVPILFIILGTIALGGVSVSRAYRRERIAHPSHNPFLDP
ncbi:protein of unknown function DUF659 [Dillenia turbinata]|uniref:BED-type domain-containing protein n=1 Tax=Dillenia turbinata TaxID=194707 RepID=A0AAN8VNS7_9MAGN